MKRHHPLAGILLFITAMFIESSQECGALGHGIHKAILFLLGHTGIVLLVAGLVVSSFIVSGLAEWLWLVSRAYRKAQQRSAMTVSRPAQTPQARRRISSQPQITIISARTVVGAPMSTGTPALSQPAAVPQAKPVKSVPRVEDAGAPTTAQAEADDVRSGLKYMGYKSHEIEPVMKMLDQRKSVAEQLRDGIGMLRRRVG